MATVNDTVNVRGFEGPASPVFHPPSQYVERGTPAPQVVTMEILSQLLQQQQQFFQQQFERRVLEALQASTQQISVHMAAFERQQRLRLQRLGQRQRGLEWRGMELEHHGPGAEVGVCVGAGDPGPHASTWTGPHASGALRVASTDTPALSPPEAPQVRLSCIVPHTHALTAHTHISHITPPVYGDGIQHAPARTALGPAAVIPHVLGSPTGGYVHSGNDAFGNDDMQGEGEAYAPVLSHVRPPAAAPRAPAWRDQGMDGRDVQGEGEPCLPVSYPVRPPAAAPRAPAWRDPGWGCVEGAEGAGPEGCHVTHGAHLPWPLGGQPAGAAGQAAPTARAANSAQVGQPTRVAPVAPDLWVADGARGTQRAAWAWGPDYVPVSAPPEVPVPVYVPVACESGSVVPKGLPPASGVTVFTHALGGMEGAPGAGVPGIPHAASGQLGGVGPVGGWGGVVTSNGGCMPTGDQRAASMPAHIVESARVPVSSSPRVGVPSAAPGGAPGASCPVYASGGGAPSAGAPGASQVQSVRVVSRPTVTAHTLHDGTGPGDGGGPAPSMPRQELPVSSEGGAGSKAEDWSKKEPEVWYDAFRHDLRLRHNGQSGRSHFAWVKAVRHGLQQRQLEECRRHLIPRQRVDCKTLVMDLVNRTVEPTSAA